MALARSFRDLKVYQQARKFAKEIYEVSKKFPTVEKFSLTDQVRRSSRSVCSNIAEGWRKRRYVAAFACKLSDADGEAAETQSWLDSALDCGYLTDQTYRYFDGAYNHICAQLCLMMKDADRWCASAGVTDEAV